MVEEKTTYYWMERWARPFRGYYIASVAMALVQVACSLMPYFIIASVIRSLVAGTGNWSYYVIEVGIAVLFTVVSMLSYTVSTTLSHKATFSVIGEVRKRLCDKLTNLPMGYLLDTSSGELKNNIVEKVDSIEPVLAHAVPEMTSSLLVPLGILVYEMVLDWRMGLVSLVTLPVGLLVMMGMMKGYEQKYAHYVQANKELNATAVEYIRGIKVIKAFNQRASSYEKFSNKAKLAADSAIEWMRDCQLYYCLGIAIVPATLIAILPVGCLFILNGTLSSSMFILFIILSLGIMKPLLHAVSFTDDFAKVKVVVHDIADILGRENLQRPRMEANIDSYDIALERVSFAYGKEPVLTDVDLKLPAGSVTALVGPSGSGKTTIARLIASQWDAKEGNIAVGGVRMENIPLSQLNDMVAFVTQDNFLFNETVMENIRCGRKDATDEMVMDIAVKSNCDTFIRKLEHGYQTVCGSGGGHLSGGEKQRISIARAMLKDAPIIILDEATSYTDPESEADIQQAVSGLVQGKTLIVIAHRLSTIIHSDKIAVINEGRVEAEGTHEELLAQCRLYKDMWEAHVSSRETDIRGAQENV